MVEVVIVGAMRTAIGGFGGTLKSVEASTLGGTVIAAALAETGLQALDVDEVIMGCGASGARVAVTLIHEMRRRRVQFGIASLCIGDGMGIASLFEI